MMVSIGRSRGREEAVATMDNSTRFCGRRDDAERRSSNAPRKRAAALARLARGRGAANVPAWPPTRSPSSARFMPRSTRFSKASPVTRAASAATSSARGASRIPAPSSSRSSSAPCGRAAGRRGARGGGARRRSTRRTARASGGCRSQRSVAARCSTNAGGARCMRRDRSDAARSSASAGAGPSASHRRRRVAGKSRVFRGRSPIFPRALRRRIPDRARSRAWPGNRAGDELIPLVRSPRGCS